MDDNATRLSSYESTEVSLEVRSVKMFGQDYSFLKVGGEVVPSCAIYSGLITTPASFIRLSQCTSPICGPTCSKHGSSGAIKGARHHEHREAASLPMNRDSGDMTPACHEEQASSRGEWS
ncbi:unnamed protein product [Peniophora sp. CBMAI 1063]|nr:unnamed protein product [Peniophora sp. CBMAI 1063]